MELAQGLKLFSLFSVAQETVCVSCIHYCKILFGLGKGVAQIKQGGRDTGQPVTSREHTRPLPALFIKSHRELAGYRPFNVSDMHPEEFRAAVYVYKQL